VIELFPVATADNSGNSRWTQPVVLSYGRLLFSAFRPAANILNLSPLYFGVRVLLSMGFAGSSLQKHILHVVQLLSQEQMVRVDAWRIVATVKNVQTVRHRSLMQLPGDAMSKPRLSFKPKRPIPGFSPSGGPKPTRFCLANLAFKSRANRLGLIH
jgi:hypothetical protein